MSANNRTLVLSDFDGTITTVDTFLHFIVFTKGKIKAAFGALLLLPVFLLYFLKIISAHRAKEIICSFFFRGKTKTELEHAGEKFQMGLQKKIREPLLNKLTEFAKQGATVAVVSASGDAWVNAFCTQYGFICICTRFEYAGEKFTGRFAGKNCQGIEKKNRVLQQFQTGQFDKIVVFGNSNGDSAMMELASEKNWVK